MRMDAKQPAKRNGTCIHCGREVEYNSEAELWLHFPGNTSVCNPQAHKIPEPYTRANPGDGEEYKLR